MAGATDATPTSGYVPVVSSAPGKPQQALYAQTTGAADATPISGCLSYRSYMC